MKAITLIVLSLVGASFSGCTDPKAAEEKARAEADAKARAGAARKEMETLPKVFRPQYHNKRLAPDPKTPPAPAASDKTEAEKKS